MVAVLAEEFLGRQLALPRPSTWTAEVLEQLVHRLDQFEVAYLPPLLGTSHLLKDRLLRLVFPNRTDSIPTKECKKNEDEFSSISGLHGNEMQESTFWRIE